MSECEFIDKLIALLGRFLAEGLTGYLPLSIALPIEDEFGQLYFPETDMITRTIAIDRIRKMSYRVEKADLDMDSLKSVDPNQIDNPPDIEDVPEAGTEDQPEETETPTRDRPLEPSGI